MPTKEDEVTILKVYQLLLSLTNDVNSKFKRLDEVNANVERLVNRIDSIDGAFPVCPSGGNKYEQHRASVLKWRKRDEDALTDRKTLLTHVRNYSAVTAVLVFLLGMWEYLKIMVKK